MTNKTYKKKYTRKNNNNRNALNKAKRTLRSLLYQNKIQNQLNRMSVANHFFGCRSINEAEQNQGAFSLWNGISTQPLCLISLRSIINAGENGNQIFTLGFNGADFSVNKTAQYLGSSGAYTSPASNAYPTTMNYRQLIHRYTQAKFLFYQQANKKVTFTVRLVTLRDDLDPLSTGLTASNAQIRRKRQLFYQYHCLRADQTNPLLKNTENYTRDIKGEFNILWSKTYTIDEQLMEDHGNDQVATKQVDIFRKFDKTINFTTKANAEPITDSNDTTGYQDPESIVMPDSNDGITSFPESKQNIWLIITSNCTKTEEDDASNFDVHTFDVLIKNKWTAPAGNIMDTSAEPQT